MTITSFDKSSPADRRKLQIVEAAISVLMEKGLTASTMNDFIRASGLSKGGVYHYFDSKEALLLGVLDYFFDQFFSEMVSNSSPMESATEQLTEIVSGHVKLLRKLGEYNGVMVDFLAHAIHVKPIREHFQTQYRLFQSAIADLIEQGKMRGEFGDTVDAKAMASGIIGVFDGTGLALMIVPDSVDFPHCAVQSALTIIAGMGKSDSNRQTNH